MKKLVFLCLFLVACQNGCPIQPTPDPVQPHPTPVPTGSEFCDLAEKRLQDLQCAEGNPTKKGERFGDVCRELQSKGIAIDPKCLSEIKTCADVDVCTHTVNPPK